MEAGVIKSQNIEGMRIALLADSFLPHAGGSRVYYYHIYKHLVAEFRDRVTVLTGKVPGWEQFDRRESTESFKIIRRFKPLPNWKYHQLPKIVFPLGEAIRLVRNDNVDLIHCGDLYPQGVIGLGLKCLLGIPYLVFCHGEEITQTDRRRYQPYVRDRVYQRADGVVAANEFGVSNLRRIGVAEDRIHKITPGVQCENFRPQPREPDLVDRFSLSGKVTLLTVGRLVPRKGHDVVLAALARILNEVPNVRYLIVGKGPERARLEALARELAIRDVVEFVGSVSDDKLPQFYNLCDVFVMPNRFESDGDIEGFGMVFLEASATCKPVVAGRTGGTAEAILDGVTGFLVDPQDVDELSAALKKLILNPALRYEMGSAGRRRAQTEFCWQPRAHDLRRLSSEILERVGQRRPERNPQSPPCIERSSRLRT